MPYLTGTILSEVTSSMPFPYVGNPTRNPVDNTSVSYGLPGANLLMLFADPEDVSRVLFSRGWDFFPGRNGGNAGGPGENLKVSHHVKGGSGMRYGVLNFRPYYSSAIFRRDRYGQFRDMLEQRQYAKFYEMGLKDGTPGPVEIRFVQVLTNQQMNSDNIVQKETDSGTGNTFGAAVKKATQSRNTSLVASSSIPFFDRDRDRAQSDGGN